MLWAAADTSGNGRYISIVIGVQNDIKTMYNRLGCDKIHMRKLCKRDKDKVRDNFELIGDVFVACIKVDKSSAVTTVYKKLEGKKHKRFVENQYDELFKYKIIQICQNFINEHNIEFGELSFEIDKDLKKAFRHSKVNTADRSIAFEIADVVANANCRKIY